MLKRMYVYAAIIATLGATGCVMQKTYDRDMGYERQLNAQLESEVAADQVKITQLQDRLRVSMLDEVLYPSGSATLSGKGKATLDKLVPTLQSATDQRIEVEGYTDDVPIGKHLKKKYKTNWELSAARAASVVEYLQKKGVDPSRMTAAGHGQFQPVNPNATDVDKAENRRIDVDLVPVYTQ
jgi:chemotaxis protein MotB